MDIEDQMDALDDQLFGDNPGEEHYPQGRDLRWEDHFLNGRESGAGPNVRENTPEELLAQGWDKTEVSAALITLADELSNEDELFND